MHMLGPEVRKCAVGDRLFPGISAGRALSELRQFLSEIGIADASKYRTHDLRRGHAKDLQLSGMRCVSWSVLLRIRFCTGAPASEIIKMGEWRSPSFMDYLDIDRHVAVSCSCVLVESRSSQGWKVT